MIISKTSHVVIANLSNNFIFRAWLDHVLLQLSTSLAINKLFFVLIEVLFSLFCATKSNSCVVLQFFMDILV